MPGRTKLSEYSNVAVQDARRNLYAFAVNKKAESLHRLRIALKKIRALKLLFENPLQNSNCNHILSAFRKLKRLNKAAGKIRNNDIYLELLQQLEKQNSGFYKDIILQRNLSAQKLTARLSGYKTGITQFRKMFFQSLYLPADKHVSEVCSKLIQKAEKGISHIHKHDFDKLHTTRKHIKSLIYLQDVVPVKIRRHFHVNVKYLDAIQHLIGQWHDAGELLEKTKKKNSTSVKKGLLDIQSKKIKKLKLLTTDFDKKIFSRKWQNENK